jgi:hypothetical protein
MNLDSPPPADWNDKGENEEIIFPHPESSSGQALRKILLLRD